MQIENSDTKVLNCFLKRRYDPIHLLGLLIKDNNGTAYVDKSQLLASPHDKDLFELFLNYFYHWDFSSPETTTIYLEFSDKFNALVGGLYDLEFKTKKNSQIIGRLFSEKAFSKYAYYQDEFFIIKDTIANL